ncbi:hypothetical protein ACFYVL_17335 [Streptomyces sp. NPDC004111]|uniref:hypothetical protein n=1 Tax=Streptomyces sp. NPDC004111 TaxID=3364690 RepID=UPI0036A13BE5
MNGSHGTGTWLRKEYIGREAELIHFSGAAKLVGLSRAAVSNWAARHEDFPKVALLTGTHLKPVKFVPLQEFHAFAAKHMQRSRSGPTPGQKQAPRRPRAEIRAAEVQHQRSQVERLTALRAAQAQRLARTTRALKVSRARLAEAEAALAAEVEAVRAAVERGLHG